jgi:Raf kinase inhibitor-like YbhB/YbcL family protein
MTKKKEISTRTIWAGTLLLVVLILGGAVFISQKLSQRQEAVPVTASAAPIAQVPAKAQVQKKAAVQPPPPVVQPAAQPPAPVIPVIEDIPAKPADLTDLMLENLAGSLKLRLPALTDGNDRIPLDYTCYRSNISPALEWSGAPAATKSFVVLMEQRKENAEPHLYWALFNIPAAAQKIDRALGGGPELPDGTRYGRNQDGVAQYAGPCDPKGQVKYAVRVFALDTVLTAPAESGLDALVLAMNGHIIDMAEVPFVHYLRL